MTSGSNDFAPKKNRNPKDRPQQQHLVIGDIEKKAPHRIAPEAWMASERMLECVAGGGGGAERVTACASIHNSILAFSSFGTSRLSVWFPLRSRDRRRHQCVRSFSTLRGGWILLKGRRFIDAPERKKR